MPAQAMGLVLISAVLHSGWNIGLKAQKDTTAGAVVLALFACLMALFTGIGSLSTALSPQVLPYTAGAGLFAGGALAALGLSFRGGSLGLSYTVSRAGGILLLWPISYTFLGERASLPAIAGATLLTFSLCLIMLQGKSESMNRHLWWALASAACIVGYSVCYKKAISGGANTFALLGLSDLLRVAVAFLLLGAGRWRKVVTIGSQSFWSLLFLGAMSFGSFSIFLYALKDAGAAQLGTLRNLSIIFTALGAVRMGEKLTWRSLILVALSAIGTILVGLK